MPQLQCPPLYQLYPTVNMNVALYPGLCRPMLALDKCPKVASAENARRGFTKMYEPNASPSVKFTAAVLPGGTLLVVNTVPPTIATYGAHFCQLVKFHCQIAGLTLAPYTPPPPGSRTA